MSTPAIRLAAIADLHIHSAESAAALATALADIEKHADALLIAGDLTDQGRLVEIEPLAEILLNVPIPIFVVFGNHDRRAMRRRALTRALRDVGATVLDGTGAIVEMPTGFRLGIAGAVGTGGGFRAGEEFGPGARFTKAAMVKSRREAARLRKTLKELIEQAPDQILVLTHFSPTESTLGEEPPLKYWMLGNALLGTTIDEFSPALVIHGHAHLGNEEGATPGDTAVLNVALPVIGGIRLIDLYPDGTFQLRDLIEVEAGKTISMVRDRDLR